METSPTHSNPVNKKNVDYTQTVQSIREFLSFTTDYSRTASEALSSVRMAFTSFKTAALYTNKKGWRTEIDTSGAMKFVGTGKEYFQATEELIQSLVKSSRRFYDAQENLCSMAVNLREHLKARLPNLNEEKIKMLEDKLQFERPNLDLLSNSDVLYLPEYCRNRNTDMIESVTVHFDGQVRHLYSESLDKLHFLEKYLAEILYSLPIKEETQVNAEGSSSSLPPLD